MRVGSWSRCCLLVVMAALGFACGSPDVDEDRCDGVICDQPPDDACRDAGVLLAYPASGSCDPDTGACSYQPDEITCEHGCSAGRCLEADPCRGVICDDPPVNACKDASTLLVYAAVGTCDAVTGACDYPATELACDHGCQDHTCQDQDLCAGVVCDTPPADTCRDLETLIVYEAAGSCDPDTGRCEYGSSDQPCERGCDAGRCLPEHEAWGWIAVLETNDTWDWSFGVSVGAYFAQAPRYRTAMPHHIGHSCAEVESSDTCTLYSSQERRFEVCDPRCEYDQECVREGEQWVCKDLPRHFDVGTLTLGGLKTDISMTADEYDRYFAEGTPDDLFDEGDVVTATTGGGELGPMSFEARGVAHMEIAGQQVRLVRDEQVTVAWTPADPDTRVLLVLMTGPHDPVLPSATLVCDAPDDAGQVKIPASLVNGFLDRHFVMQKSSRIIRYTRDVQTPYGQEIELMVGSSRGLEVLTP